MDVWEDARMTLKRKWEALEELSDPLIQLNKEIQQAKAKRACYKKETRTDRHNLYYEHRNLDLLFDICDSGSSEWTILDVKEYHPLISWLQHPEQSPWRKIVDDIYERYEPIEKGDTKHLVFVSKHRHPVRVTGNIKMVLDDEDGDIYDDMVGYEEAKKIGSTLCHETGYIDKECDHKEGCKYVARVPFQTFVLRRSKE